MGQSGRFQIVVSFSQIFQEYQLSCIILDVDDWCRIVDDDDVEDDFLLLENQRYNNFMFKKVQ